MGWAKTNDCTVFKTSTVPPCTMYHSLNGSSYRYVGMKEYCGIPTVRNIDCCQKLAPPLIAVNAYTVIKMTIPSTGPETMPSVRVFV